MKRKIGFYLRSRFIEGISLLAFRFSFTRRIFWTKQYNYIAEMLNDGYIFMNLGYASLEPSLRETPLRTLSEVDMLSENLYRHVIGDSKLQDKDVLEVGCGRGGGCLFIERNYNPRLITAVDIAYDAIKRSKKAQKKTMIQFQQADAMSLPFSDNSYDVVINIESSHCYPSRKKFFQESFRVLRPGGFLLYADLVSYFADNVSLKQIKKYLINSGYETIREEDITKNVVRSRDMLSDSGLFDTAMEKWLEEDFMKLTPSIIAETKKGYYLKGTPGYKLLKKGIISYWAWILRKPPN